MCNWPKLFGILDFLVLDIWNLSKQTFVSNGNARTSHTFLCKSYQWPCICIRFFIWLSIYVLIFFFFVLCIYFLSYNVYFMILPCFFYLDPILVLQTFSSLHNLSKLHTTTLKLIFHPLAQTSILFVANLQFVLHSHLQFVDLQFAL
jgi:hypothetical protein